MTSRRCPQCGRRYPSSYRRCPYCAEQRRGERRRPASLPSQLLEFLRQNNTRIFVGGAAFFLCIAILGMLLTQCGKPKEDPEPEEPVKTEQPAEPLTISRTAATLAVGESLTLSVSGDFDALTWTSSDGAVASVSDGRVTGKAAGTAEITAASGTESVSCTVTVEAPPPPSIPELALNRTDFTIRPGDPTPVQMKVRIKGTREEYTGEVVWASQDVSVATVSETGAVEKVGRGTTIVTATAGDQVLECIVRVR